MRRVVFLAVALTFMGATEVPLLRLSFTSTPISSAEVAASGATAPAPFNPSFEAEPEPEKVAAAAGRGGAIEPPSWRLEKGVARPDQRENAAKEGAIERYARLEGEEATLVSSPFTLSQDTRKFSFQYKFFETPPAVEESPAATPTATATSTPAPVTATPTPSPTPEAATATPTATAPLPSATTAATATPEAATATPTPTALPASATSAATLEASTATPTPESATATPAVEESPAATSTPTQTPTPEASGSGARSPALLPASAAVDLGRMGLGAALSAPAARPQSAFQVYVLSGANFQTETEVFSLSSKNETSWDKVFVDVGRWSGQTIQLKVVRAGDSAGAIGIDDVAIELIEQRIGRAGRAAHVADPVNTSNGNMTLSSTDILVPGKGIPLEFTRTYNSDSNYNGALGHKWTHNYGLSVTAEPDGSATVRYGDGHTANFESDTPNTPPSIDEVSTDNTGGDLSWTHDTGTGSDRVLLVGAYRSKKSSSGAATATYNGQTLTKLAEVVGSGNTPRLEVWYLLNPASGSKNVSVDFPFSDSVAHGISVTLTGVRQVVPGFASGEDWATTTSLTVPSDAGSLVVDFVSGLIADQEGENENEWLFSSEQDETLANLAKYASGYWQRFASSMNIGSSPSAEMVWHSQWAFDWQHIGVSLPGIPTGGATTFTAPNGNYDALVRNGNSTYTLTTSSQVSYNFNSSGRLTSIVDRNGNTTSLSYTSTELTTVTDAAGRTLSFSYDGNGRIRYITDPLSRVHEFQYVNGDLMYSKNLAGKTTTYVYNSHRLDYSYDPLARTTFLNEIDNAGRVVEQQDAAQKVTCLYYGSGPSHTSSNCPGVSPSPSAGQTVVVNPRGYKTTYDFDGDFRTTQVKDHYGKTVQYSYDGNDNVTCVTNQLGHKTAMTYDAKGNVTGIIDAKNTNGSCQLKGGGVMTTMTYTAKNDIDVLTDTLGRITDNNYDTPGNLTEVIRKDNAGAVKARACFTVNGAGLVTEAIESTTLTNCTGNKTLYGYNSHGLRNEVVNARFSGQGSPPKTTATYDAGGRRLTVTNELSHTTTWTYDAMNRVLTSKDALNNTTTNTYDNGGNLASVTDAMSKTTTYTYDNLDRLKTVTDALSGVTTYNYDNNGNRTSVVNPRGKTSSATYDAIDRLISSTDPLSRTAYFEYDDASNLVERTDARGLVTNYVYDELGRKTLVEYLVSGVVDSDVVYVYTTNPSGNRRTYVYDTAGTWIHEQDALDRTIGVWQPGGQLVWYAYDEVGNMKTLSYPDSKWTHYFYDEAHNPISLKDWSDRETWYTYDNAGQVSYLYNCPPGGCTSRQEYFRDDAERVTYIRNMNELDTTPAIASDYWHLYNGVGNKAQMSEPTHGAGIEYVGYDNLHRLTSMAYAGGPTDTYTYDANGNRLTKNATGYTYDDADQMTVAGGVSYGYDANGNLTSRGSDSFTWDHENRLVSATVSSVTTTYTYSPSGLRMSETTGGVTTSYVWNTLSSAPMLLMETTSGVTTWYVNGPNGLVCSVNGSDEATYRFTDGLGSTTELLDEDGDVVGTYRHDVFGIPRSHTGASTEFTYTGEQADPNGLTYLRARYYDPAVGRFLSLDPLGGGYVYGLNSTVNFRDPTGLAAEGQCTFYNYSSQSWLPCGLQDALTAVGIEPATAFVGLASLEVNGLGENPFAFGLVTDTLFTVKLVVGFNNSGLTFGLVVVTTPDLCALADAYCTTSWVFHTSFLDHTPVGDHGAYVKYVANFHSIAASKVIGEPLSARVTIGFFGTTNLGGMCIARSNVTFSPSKGGFVKALSDAGLGGSFVTCGAR